MLNAATPCISRWDCGGTRTQRCWPRNEVGSAQSGAQANTRDFCKTSASVGKFRKYHLFILRFSNRLIIEVAPNKTVNYKSTPLSFCSRHYASTASNSTILDFKMYCWAALTICVDRNFSVCHCPYVCGILYRGSGKDVPITHQRLPPLIFVVLNIGVHPIPIAYALYLYSYTSESIDVHPLIGGASGWVPLKRSLHSHPREIVFSTLHARQLRSRVFYLYFLQRVTWSLKALKW